MFVSFKHAVLIQLIATSSLLARADLTSMNYARHLQKSKDLMKSMGEHAKDNSPRSSTGIPAQPLRPKSMDKHGKDKSLRDNTAIPAQSLRLQSSADPISDSDYFVWNLVTCDLQQNNDFSLMYATSNYFQTCFTGYFNGESFFYKLKETEVDSMTNGEISGNNPVAKLEAHRIECKSADCSENCVDNNVASDAVLSIDTSWTFPFSWSADFQSNDPSTDTCATSGVVGSKKEILYPLPYSIMDEIPDGSKMFVTHYFSETGASEACHKAKSNGLSDGFQTVPVTPGRNTVHLEVKAVQVMDTCLTFIDESITSGGYSYMYRSDMNCGDYEYWTSNLECTGNPDGSFNTILSKNDDDDDIIVFDAPDTCVLFKEDDFVSYYCGVKGSNVAPSATGAESLVEAEKIAIAAIVLACVSIAIALFVVVSAVMKEPKEQPHSKVEMVEVETK